jgi:hypothetical protein
MPPELQLPPDQQPQKPQQPKADTTQGYEAGGAEAAAQPSAKAPAAYKSWDYGYGAADQGLRRGAAGTAASQVDLGTQQQLGDDNEGWGGASQQVPEVSV